MRRFFLILTILLFLSCHKNLKREYLQLEKGQYGREVEENVFSIPSEAIKDIDREGLIKVLEIIIPNLSSERIFNVGNKTFSSNSYREKLKTLLNLLKEGADSKDISLYISDNFEVIKLNHKEDEKTLFTGYYIPIFEGRRIKDDLYKYPIYRKPPDLLKLKLSFLFKNLILFGRFDGKSFIVPYYSREDIERNRALDGKGLEIAYLSDPLSVILIQIQGSGILKLEDGKFYLVAYSAKNGYPYKSIGKYIASKNYLNEDEVSFDNIKKFLQDNPDKYDEIIFQNQSYIFFELKNEVFVKGSFGLELIPKHSIAVDPIYIPPLAMCFLDLYLPIVGEDGFTVGYKKFGDFAFAMDEGSAIKGDKRIDIFFGIGRDAEKVAKRLKSEGNLLLLIPKE